LWSDGRSARPSRAQLGRFLAGILILIFCDLCGHHRILKQHNRAEARMSKVNIAEKFAKITDYCNPRIAAELNGQQVKVVKLNGEFVFHHHEHEDEMFLVVKGRFRMEFRERHIWIEEGEFIVVPRGVDHRPVAEDECWIVLFEPATTLNTGNVDNELTVRELERA
jgi:mannose-6-phosphate isomerase-like protein (cupin superfamily)